MSVLNFYQRLDRVISGLPFGDGASGDVTISSDPNTRATATGTLSSTTLTIGSAILSNGDLFMIHQTQGTGAGQYEFNLVASGGGTTSIVCATKLQYTYVTGAQVIKITRYNNVTVNAHSVTAWNGSTGGVEVICGRTSITESGNLAGNGLGFRGGVAGGVNLNVTGNQGESGLGVGTSSTAANGGGAGGGAVGSSGGNQAGAAGGGAGHGTAGGVGGFNGSGATMGSGGTTYDNSDGTAITLGSAGGAGGSGTSGGDNTTPVGGAGGALVFYISKTITLNSTVNVSGAVGTVNSSNNVGGVGGGAGGAFIGICNVATLGTNQVTASGASGLLNGQSTGGTGGSGIVALHHSGVITGTTTPTFTDVSDTSYVETAFMGGMI